MRCTRILLAPALGFLMCLSGCHHPSVTAVSLNGNSCGPECSGFWGLMHHCLKKQEEGIPFYLPKPLLVVAKNFRNIEETKVGLTDGAPIPNYFDDQAKYGDLNARTNFQGMDGTAATGSPAATSPANTFPSGDAGKLATASPAHIYSSTGAPMSPGEAPADGLKPESFFTYHIIFVPDLTQKYGLKIKGGAGEIRAAMNLVNGWQFTGLGPYYMKDSSTAQNTLATGITANLAASGVADVVKAVASLKPGAAPGGGRLTGGGALPALDVNKAGQLADALRQLNPKFLKIPGYAEISIYEPYIGPDGTMDWKLVAEKSFDRDVVATNYQPQEILRLLDSAVSTSTGFPTSSGQFSGPSTQAPTLGSMPDEEAPPLELNSPPPGGPGIDVPSPAPGLAPPPPHPSVVPPAGGAPGHSAGQLQGAHSSSSRNPIGDAPPLRRPQLRPASGAREQLPALPLGRVGSRRDAAVVQAQAVVPPASYSSATGSLILAPTTDSGPVGDNLTAFPNPVILVPNVPPNTTVRLLRDNQVVNQGASGAEAARYLAIADNLAGEVSPGVHSYAAEAALPDGSFRRLAAGTIGIEGTPASPPTTPPPAAAAFSNEVLRQLAPQFAALSAPVSGKVAPTSPTVVAPVGTPPSSGNQVTLNQFFGHSKVPAATAPRERFSLFHHKKSRPTIRTVDIDGLETATATFASNQIPTGMPNAPATVPTTLGSSNYPAPTTAPVVPTAPQPPAPQPPAPQPPAPSVNDGRIPGTGS